MLPRGPAGSPARRQPSAEREDERPGDDLPAAEPAGKLRALGIAKAAEDDGGDHQEIAGQRDADPPLESAKPTTVALPTPENSQNSGFGRSPPRRTPKMAVASGSRPMKTIECAEVMCCSASAVSSGKADHDAQSYDRQARARSPRSGRACRNSAGAGRAEQRRDDGAGGGQEQGREVRRRRRASPATSR